MGALSSCCTSDSANREEIDITRRQEEKPLLDADSVISAASLNTHIRRGSASFSRFNMPNITIKPEPIIADHIFHYPRYLEKRQDLEHFIEDNYDIEQITYDQNEWLIFSKNSKIFDECRTLFDIIIWRLPVIEAYGKVVNDCQTYIEEKLKINPNHDSTIFSYSEIIRGIWDILPTDQFTDRFGSELYDKLDYISNNNHDYLKHEKSATNLMKKSPTLSVYGLPSQSQSSIHHLPKNNTMSLVNIPDYIEAELPPSDGHPGSNSNYQQDREFQALASKLTRIKQMQKRQIVIIGQRRVVRYIIRKIRELEVEHPAMRPFIYRKSQSDMNSLLLPMGDTPGANEAMIARGRAASRLVMYTVAVENIPPNTKEEDVIDFFKEYGKVLDVTLRSEVEINNVNFANVDYVQGGGGDGTSGTDGVVVGGEHKHHKHHKHKHKHHHHHHHKHKHHSKRDLQQATHRKNTKSEALLDKSLNEVEPEDDIVVVDDGGDGTLQPLTTENANSNGSNASNASNSSVKINNNNNNNMNNVSMTSESNSSETDEENLKQENSVTTGTTATTPATLNSPPKQPAMIAQIAFETQAALDRVVKAAESENGLEFRGYMLVVKADSTKIIEKRRKKRRVTAESKVF